MYEVLEVSIKDFGDLTGGRDVGRQKKTGYEELDGDAKIEYFFNKNQKMILDEIHSHLQKTTIPSLLSELNDSEILLKKAQKNAKKAKKNIEKTILYK